MSVTNRQKAKLTRQTRSRCAAQGESASRSRSQQKKATKTRKRRKAAAAAGPSPTPPSHPLEVALLPADPPPPADYIFVPRGNVYITRNSRLLTHAAHQIVYIVPHPRNPKHTLGIHVPRDIHATVLARAAATSEARQQAVAAKDARETRHATDLLRRVFPYMPAEEERAVLGHAFLKGSGRVGRSGKVKSEEKKVELAVEAHIRHVHTQYEALLEGGMEREDAREKVWEEVKQVKKRWKEGD